MIFNKGFFLIFFRVIIILALAIAVAYSYFQTELSITPFMFSALLLIAVLELTWHLHKQERNWMNFLQAIKYGDFNRTYQRRTNSRELQEAYDIITKSMEELQTNKEAEFRLLQTVLRHVSVAVVCYKENGEVVFTNKAFASLLELPGLIHVDKLKEAYPRIHQLLKSEDAAPSEWVDHKNGQKLFVKTESFKLKRTALKLASLADIRSSLDAKELESYQKLMRVMTHEIMNSTTPVLSLIKVVNKKLINGETLTALDSKDQRNVAMSLEAIEERTAGMLKFVEAYKQINRPIQPHLESVESTALFESVTSLMNSEHDVNLKVKDEFNGQLMVDRHLFSQVLINLIKNAREATGTIDKPELEMTIRSEAQRVHINIADNGPGVAETAISEIFIPFYTTKKEGSGIGLALSRKIVRAHGGFLSYNRVDDKTQFTINLPRTI